MVSSKVQRLKKRWTLVFDSRKPLRRENYGHVHLSRRKRVISQGAITAPMFSLKGPAMVQSKFPTAFPLKCQQKDMRLALGLAESLFQSTPIAAVANELYKLPEWTPDVQYYSDEEFQWLNHALSYNNINAPEVDKVCKAPEVGGTATVIRYLLELGFLDGDCITGTPDKNAFTFLYVSNIINYSPAIFSYYEWDARLRSSLRTRLEDMWWGEFQLDQQLALKSGDESRPAIKWNSIYGRMLESRNLSYVDGPLDDSFLLDNVQRICICDT
ncbi:glyoxylate/succinic semialdehyde reductase 2, chloroplastic, partial [Tanacetum coccineum]